MSNRLAISLHQARLALTTGRSDFLVFARSYLGPLLDLSSDEPNIEATLTWDAALPAEGQAGLEQLGRRLWAGTHHLRHTEIWQAPGLQIDIGWEGGTLVVHAAYSWPSRRARWTARLMDSVRERIFVLLIYYLVYFPCAWRLERESGWTLMHASAIATNKGGLVFSGLPGCGKSSSALAALNAPEWQIVSDNLLFTDGAQVFACPEPIHVDAQTRALVGDLAGRVRPTGRRFSHRRQDYEIAPEARQSSATPRALGFLHVGRETDIRPVDQLGAAHRLMANDCLAKEWMAYQESAAAMHQVWPSIGDHERRIKNLSALARSVQCYDVTVARNENIQRAMQTITQAMLNG